MADPYPDGGATRRGAARPRSGAGAGAGAGTATPRRWPLVPFVLAALLVLIVAVAAGRGGDAPTLVAATPDAPTDAADLDADDSAVADDDTAANPGAETDGDRSGDAPVTGPDESIDDAEVLGTATTPSPAPEPTPTVRVEDLPTSGSGEFVAAPAAERPIGMSPYRRFTVAVETGVGVDEQELAAFVDTVLADERSWIGDGITGFRRVGPDEPVDFTLVVATPDTVDRLCAPLQTAGQYSCGANGWIALNLHRWMTATPEWPASLEVYRHYLVNHEVGHYVLGGNHDSCPEPGALAPIMMQQTIDLDGCRPNGWVYPRRS